MKKAIFFMAILLIANSCNSDRDVSDVKLETEKLQTSSKVVPGGPLCIVPPPPVSFYGNPNDYPKIVIPSYYSVNSLADPSDDSWLFNQLMLGTTAYVNRHYMHKRASFQWSTTQAYLSDFTYDYEQAFTIYSSEQGLNGEINTTDHLISAVAGSYLQYRILSSIDEYAIWRQNEYGVNVKPRGITYSYSTTMCGEYTGLQVRVFYNIYP